ncbi:MAG: FAD-binding oxidoreductase, partial [Deltaproteobacteria bacterium]|nr:FAD-binding oxidoreductase [Deltaproteobacteria bacterium]
GGLPITVKLGMMSRDFYRALSSEVGVDAGFRETGYVVAATTEVEKQLAEARVPMQRELGLDVRLIDALEVKRFFPFMHTAGILTATYCPTDGYILPPKLVRSYTVALVRSGIPFYEHCEVTGLLTERGRVRGVETTRGRFEAPVVVNAGGPWAGAIAERFGVTVHAKGARHQIYVTAPRPEFAAVPPMFFDVAQGVYFRHEEGGLLIGMSDPEEEPSERKDFDWDYLEKVGKDMEKRISLLKDTPISRVWVGTIDYTVDHLPIIDEVPGVKGLFTVTAGGAGMMWGPGVARLASELIAQGQTKSADIAMLRLDRFDAQGNSKYFDPMALPFPKK